MAANGVKTSEDAEMTECDGDKVVTMMDVLKEQEDFEDDANAVLGASDDKNCTYSKGYVKRQAIYACLTCCPDASDDPKKRAGVCLACSLTCHENHELVELYTKRNFRCDCGNPKFSQTCQFTPNKSDLNYENKYNQNFSGVYCVCHRPYPDPEATEEEEMIQCIICEDWLHINHLEATVPNNEQYAEMVCKDCMEDNDFLHDYSDIIVNIADKEIIVTDPDLDAYLKKKALKEAEKKHNVINGDTETPKDKEVEPAEVPKEIAVDVPKEIEAAEVPESIKSADNTSTDVEMAEAKPDENGEKVDNTEHSETKPDQSEEKADTPEQCETKPDKSEEKIDNPEGSEQNATETTKDENTNPDINETEEKNNEEEKTEKTESEAITSEKDVEKPGENITNTSEISTAELETTETADNAPKLEDVIADSENTEKIDASEVFTEKADAASEESTTKIDASEFSTEKIVASEIPTEKEDEEMNGHTSNNSEKETNSPTQMKRKLSTEDADTANKKAKLDTNPCIRPRGVKRVYKGATFWPSTLRQKLCTCNECISMYKDLAVLFLIDPDDTVTAYEALGKQNNEGPSSQYEKGLQALSSLDRVQQINALTEYNKMRDKLLDFLKSFKDRREIVKEEDIKAFFAGMKPKREPDGVYFCR